MSFDCGLNPSSGHAFGEQLLASKRVSGFGWTKTVFCRIWGSHWCFCFVGWGWPLVGPDHRIAYAEARCQQFSSCQERNHMTCIGCVDLRTTPPTQGNSRSAAHPTDAPYSNLSRPPRVSPL